MGFVGWRILLENSTFASKPSSFRAFGPLSKPSQFPLSPASGEREGDRGRLPRVYRELADHDRLSRCDRLRISFHLRARVPRDAVCRAAKASRRLVDLELRPAVGVNCDVVSNLQPRWNRGTVQADRIVAERRN